MPGAELFKKMPGLQWLMPDRGSSSRKSNVGTGIHTETSGSTRKDTQFESPGPSQLCVSNGIQQESPYVSNGIHPETAIHQESFASPLCLDSAIHRQPSPPVSVAGVIQNQPEKKFGSPPCVRLEIQSQQPADSTSFSSPQAPSFSSPQPPPFSSPQDQPPLFSSSPQPSVNSFVNSSSPQPQPAAIEKGMRIIRSLMESPRFGRGVPIQPVLVDAFHKSNLHNSANYSDSMDSHLPSSLPDSGPEITKFVQKFMSDEFLIRSDKKGWQFVNKKWDPVCIQRGKQTVRSIMTGLNNMSIYELDAEFTRIGISQKVPAAVDFVEIYLAKEFEIASLAGTLAVVWAENNRSDLFQSSSGHSEQQLYSTNFENQNINGSNFDADVIAEGMRIARSLLEMPRFRRGVPIQPILVDAFRKSTENYHESRLNGPFGFLHAQLPHSSPEEVAQFVRECFDSNEFVISRDKNGIEFVNKKRDPLAVHRGKEAVRNLMIKKQHYSSDAQIHSVGSVGNSVGDLKEKDHVSVCEIDDEFERMGISQKVPGGMDFVEIFLAREFEVFCDGGELMVTWTGYGEHRHQPFAVTGNEHFVNVHSEQQQDCDADAVRNWTSGMNLSPGSGTDDKFSEAVQAQNNSHAESIYDTCASSSANVENGDTIMNQNFIESTQTEDATHDAASDAMRLVRDTMNKISNEKDEGQEGVDINEMKKIFREAKVKIPNFLEFVPKFLGGEFEVRPSVVPMGSYSETSNGSGNTDTLGCPADTMPLIICRKQVCQDEKKASKWTCVSMNSPDPEKAESSQTALLEMPPHKSNANASTQLDNEEVSLSVSCESFYCNFKLVFSLFF